MKQVQELKKEIQDINTKLEALESLDEGDGTPDDKPTGTSEGDEGKNTSTPAKSKEDPDTVPDDEDKRDDEDIDDNSDDDYVAEDELNAKNKMKKRW